MHPTILNNRPKKYKENEKYKNEQPIYINNSVKGEFKLKQHRLLNCSYWMTVKEISKEKQNNQIKSGCACNWSCSYCSLVPAWEGIW